MFPRCRSLANIVALWYKKEVLMTRFNNRTGSVLGASPMATRLVVAFLSALWLAAGCGPSTADYNRLKEENKQLRAELDDIKFGASRLYAEAIVASERGDFQAAQKSLSLLAQRHPESPQTESSQALAAKVNAQLEKEAKARAAQDAEQRRLAAMPKWPYAGIRVKIMDSQGNINKGTVLDRPPIQLDRVAVALDNGGTCEVRWVSLGSQLSEDDFDKFSQALDKLKKQWDEK